MSVKTYHNKPARKQLTDLEVTVAEDKVAIMNNAVVCNS